MIQGLRTTNEGTVLPTSKTLLEELGLSTKEYIAAKEKLLSTTDKIYDIRLRMYQNNDIEVMLKRNSNGVFNQQRLGKTPTTLLTIKERNIAGKILIIAPKSVLKNWENEVHTWLGLPAVLIKGTARERERLYRDKNNKIYIGTYQTIAIDFAILPEFKCLVVDEAHRLRNFKGTRSKRSPMFTKKIMKLSYSIPIKFALTGTPSANYAYEIFPILHLLYPELFKSYWAFLEYYFDSETVYLKNGEKTTKPTTFKDKNKEKEMIEFLEVISIQRKRKDHMKWVPDVEHLDVSIEMSKKERKLYDEFTTTFESEELGIDCSSQLTLFQQSIKFTGELKMNYVLDYIKEYDEESIIVTSIFTSVLFKLKEHIPEAELLIGDTTVMNRTKIQDEFNNGKIRVILANTNVICEGMKLERGNTILEITPALTYTNNEQLYDRILPTTKEKALEKDAQKVIHLTVEDSIDQYLDNALKNKLSSTEIINNYASYMKKINTHG